MTPEQIETIEATASAVAADPRCFATRFYERLFTLAPRTRELFPDDMTEQMGKLVDEVVFLAGAASDLVGFTERARELGARHQHYGVRVGDYAVVELALLAGLAEVLGSAYTEEVEAAWRRLYHLVSETMLDGASGELFAAR